MKNKKILLITTVPSTFQFILRGQPRYLSQYYDVALVSSGRSHLKMFAASEGVASYFVPMRRGISPFFDLWSIACLIYVILKFKPDIVHSYTPKAGLIAAISGFVCRVPARIHTFTGLIFPTSAGFRQVLLKNIDKLVCRLCTHIVPEGLGVRQDLINYNVCTKPMQLIGSGNIAGIDLDEFNPSSRQVVLATAAVRKLFSHYAGARVFCFVGRLNGDKGVNELVSCFERLAEIENVVLLVAGDIDEENPISDHSLTALKSHSRIFCFGFVDDVRPIICASDILVLPSYREGFPNVVLQAGALSKPCIVTDVNGSNEIIIGNINGVIVPPKDLDALYSAMKDAVGWGAAKLHAMGELARTRIVEGFERKQYLATLTRYYESL